MSIPEPQFDDLYREVIIDHTRRPRNKRRLENPTQHAEGMNPVCGDAIEIDLEIRDGAIEDVAFRGEGCAISQSSASMLTERLKGRSTAEARQVLAKFRAMMLEGTEPDQELGDLESLQGVAKFPVRVKCALLCWNVLEAGLQQATTAV